MDFRIPGLSHSVVKHAQSTSVPDRHALQQDLRQNQAFYPFSPESKKMIQEVGNIELFELLETDPKTECKACLTYWNVGIVYCTCGHFLQSSRREDFTATDMGKSQETNNIIWLTNRRRNAKRKSSKEFMTDSY